MDCWLSIPGECYPTGPLASLTWFGKISGMRWPFFFCCHSSQPPRMQGLDGCYSRAQNRVLFSVCCHLPAYNTSAMGHIWKELEYGSSARMLLYQAWVPEFQTLYCKNKQTKNPIAKEGKQRNKEMKIILLEWGGPGGSAGADIT
jgi:hypothetical protein